MESKESKVETGRAGSPEWQREQGAGKDFLKLDGQRGKIVWKWRVHCPKRGFTMKQPGVLPVSLCNVSPAFLIRNTMLFVMSKLFYIKLLREGKKIPRLHLSLPLAGVVATQAD